MPEGDTVFRAARSLHAALAGRTLTRTDFRVPHLAGADLAGQAVVEVRSRGKHLLLRTDSGWTLHTHLRMDGSWALYRPGDRWTGGPGHQVRAALHTEEYVAVAWRMPVVDLVRTEDEDRVVGHLGPDLLGPDWDRAKALRNLLRDPARRIADALLDQRNLAGVGNLFKNEVLFLKGEHPENPVEAVRDLAGMLDLAKRLLEASVRESGLQSTTGRRRKSERHWVFERPGQPCRRCGALVRVTRQGDVPGQERLTYWCPQCQKRVESRDAVPTLEP